MGMCPLFQMFFYISFHIQNSKLVCLYSVYFFFHLHTGVVVLVVIGIVVVVVLSNIT